MLCGAGMVKAWGHTQANMASSNAEANFIAAAKGASEGLAARSLTRDVGHESSVRVWIDSSAVFGVRTKFGDGKIRNSDTRLLWIQDLVCVGGLILREIAREQNPADLMTMQVGSDQSSANLVRLRCWPREGRVEAVLRCEVVRPKATMAERSPCIGAGVPRRIAGEEGCKSARRHSSHGML